MGLEKDHIIYTAEDIQKYLSGKLGPAEMHAMEKAALDDAFLAEAMEGYAGMQEKDPEPALIDLKKNFAKTQTAKVVPFKTSPRYTVWKIAAAAIVIFGGLTITYLLINNGNTSNQSIARVATKKDSVSGPTIAPVTADSIGKGTGDMAAKRQEPPAAERSVVQNSIPPPDLKDSEFIYRPKPVEKLLAKKDPGGGYQANKIETKDDLSLSNTAPAEKQNEVVQSKAAAATGNLPDNADKKIPVLMRKFAAQIVAPDGSPLPFANISITSENVGTYADAKGNFRLVSADSSLNVEIKSAGYLTRNITLASGLQQNKIMLSEDELALKDKTQVTTSSALFKKEKSRRSALVSDSLINVEPEDGWSNYDTYITNNLSVSKDVLKKKIHGEVEVSFEVQSNGALANVKVDKSLCDDCDEAALRVIKDGPRWRIKNGNQSIGKVKVKF